MNSTPVLHLRSTECSFQRIANRLSGAILILLSALNSFADTKPASPFTDHMVLQRNVPVPVWGTASPGEKVTVSFGKQQRSITTGRDGKWMIRLGALTTGGPFAMQIAGQNTVTLRDIYVGEVWLCSGQSNMDMTVAREDRYWCGVYNEKQELATADYPLIRVFDVDFVPSEEEAVAAKGKWEISSPATVGHFSAAAYFFARELYRRYKIPIGLITTAYGASTAEAWTAKKTLESYPAFAALLRNYQQRRASYDTSFTARQKYATAFAKWETDSAAAREAKKDPPREPKNPDPGRDQHSPYVLYNGMVAPLIPYAIRGAIWYQGESNIPTVSIYDRLMSALIDNWRRVWGEGAFPFIYVQLANYGKHLDTIPGKGGGTTLVRERQLNNLSIPNTAMVVAIDNADDPANIHPKNKQEIGRRLALNAEALAYGEKIPYSGPVYEKMKIEGQSIRLSFAHTEGGLMARGNDSSTAAIPGLTSAGGKLTGFAIAGADKQFVWADASIEGETILVSGATVADPVAVRYGWGDNPPVSLYNRAGLPASPFRTDHWGDDPPASDVRGANSWRFDFGSGNADPGAVPVTPNTVYTPQLGYGFDLGSAFAGSGPFFFSVKLPEGNYNIKATLGDAKQASVTTIKVECRRLMAEKITTLPGQFVTKEFTVHIRDSVNHAGGVPVRLKAREHAFLHWDDKLTLEFTNSAPRLSKLEISPAEHPITVFLAGNSTVVDQAEEPWAAWGQMIPAFFQPEKIVIANYAESGETLKAFVNEGRLDKVWSMARPGDYLFIEFAHNDQKEGLNHLDPFTTYKEELGWYIGEARLRGMIPVLVTSMHRRNFDSTGHIVNTLGDFPEAMRQTARELNTGLVDLNAMSKILYEAWGPEGSIHAFVHYPAHSFPGQEKELKDDTHFNSYGAYELAKCIVKGIKENLPDLSKYLEQGFPVFDPAHPDPVQTWNLPMSQKIDVKRPDGDVNQPLRPAEVQLVPVLETGSLKPMPDEWIDKDTHHRIIRLTRRKGGNASFYFHNNPFIGNRMVFYNTDSSGKQIYTVDLKTLQLQQIARHPSPMTGEIVARKSRSVFYQVKDSVFSTNIDTRQTRRVFVFPPDFRGSVSSLNADETLLAGAQSGDEAKEIFRKYPEKSQYFDRIYDAHVPHTLFTVDTRTGELKKIHQENTWLGHVQFSPTDPLLLMFCHEGPWHKVDRIWTINVQTGASRLMHKRTMENEIAGHEFFSPDGKTIHFDWQLPKGQTFFLGSLDLQTGTEKKYQMTRDEWSIHFNVSPDQKLYAGDGGDSGQVAKANNGRWIYLFRPEGDHFVSEKLVNMKYQYYKLEPNVHFSPDGQWIIFRANFEGREDVYAVEINEIIKPVQ